MKRLLVGGAIFGAIAIPVGLLLQWEVVAWFGLFLLCTCGSFVAIEKVTTLVDSWEAEMSDEERAQRDEALRRFPPFPFPYM